MIATLHEWMTPGDLTLPWSVVLIVASAFTSALTASLGIGGGVALVTVMLNILPPAIVLPIHGLVQWGSNGGRAWLMRAHVDWRIIGWLSVGCVIGAIAGWRLFVALPVNTLQIILAVFIIWSVWTPKLKANAIPRWAFLPVGALTSLASMFIGASGVLLGAFWNVDRMGKLGLVGTHATAMTIQHGLKVLAFGAIGFAFLEWMPLTLAMVASGFVGTILGKALLTRLPEAAFKMVFRLMLTALALRLLWTALR